VPQRNHRLCHKGLYALNVKEPNVTVKEYEGIGHVLSGAELRDLCAWLEKVIPKLSDGS
jgi:lysophospholipase-1